jgi:hypothetical protein
MVIWNIVVCDKKAIRGPHHDSVWVDLIDVRRCCSLILLFQHHFFQARCQSLRKRPVEILIAIS